ncbi:hypothetical protein [Marinicella sp. W31]|uniref:hypothetical protein n=1 Tax=Marinicella sp. W31 TaxID=3023713 RepID=UPI003757CA4F
MKYIKSHKNKKRHRRLMLLILWMMVLSPSFAQDYQITRHLIGSGGGKSEFAPNESYAITGSVGQVVTGTSQNPSAGYTLTSGFWPAQRDLIFANGFDYAL